MLISFAGFIRLLISLLTEEERQGCLVYALGEPLRAGEMLHFPGIQITIAVPSYLAFIDRQPAANWGHPARYVIAPRRGGEAQSLEAHLPPFSSGSSLSWRLVYHGPSVPDALVPKLSTKSKSTLKKEH